MPNDSENVISSRLPFHSCLISLHDKNSQFDKVSRRFDIIADQGISQDGGHRIHYSYA